MSPSEPRRESFPFNVRVTRRGRVSDDSQVTVIDGHNRISGQGTGSLQLRLPRGFYAVRVERGGAITEDVRRHDGPTKIVLPAPERFSAVPASDTASPHGYYRQAAVTWSERTTAPAIRGRERPRGSLVVFLRAPAAGAAPRTSLGAGLRLLDYAGTGLARLSGDSVRSDRQTGWLAFHSTLPAGEYALHYKGDPKTAVPGREMALAVFAGWQTQLFMTCTDGPLFASASVLMSRKGFHPDDHVPQAVDSALAGLQNGTNLLSAEDRKLLLYGKFDNPMLGLVGTHVLLSSAGGKPPQVKHILYNLRRLLGDAPDVRALELIAAERFGIPSEPRPFERPPLLRPGLEAVLLAAASRPELVPRESFLARLAPSRYVDSPWSTWQPLLRRRRKREEPPPEWLTSYLHDAETDAAKRDTDIDLESVAAGAGLPAASVAGAYEHLRKTMPPGDARTLELERIVARSRRQGKEAPPPVPRVRQLFREGSEGERIEALGLMQGAADPRHLDSALEGITDSRSAFEQYHALRLARKIVPDLGPQQRRKLEIVIDTQRSDEGWIKPGSDRWYLSEQILDEIS